jgi:hypothetical protein
MKKTTTQKNMSTRTLGLIIFLILVSGVLIYTAGIQKTPQQTQTSIPTPVVMPVAIGNTILSLSSGIVSAYNTNTVNLMIDSQGDNVTAVQGEISYDPAMVTNVHLTQGTFFENPIVLFNQIDQKNGRISYAIAIQPQGQAQMGVGTVATISYNLMPGAKGPITFTFLPKTKVTAEGIAQSVLKTATGATFNLPTN